MKKYFLVISLLGAIHSFSQDFPNGWTVSGAGYNRELMENLKQLINTDSLKNITSIIAVKDGKLLIEEYFNGYTRDSLHDTRSVGKTFTSALTGIAIYDGYLENENQKLKDFYDLRKYRNYSHLKDSVSVKNLLTMSSGFLGFDFDENSPGNEENMYPQNNWVEWALNLPMDSSKTPGSKWEYFTAGIVILGDILNSVAPGGLEKYAEEKLFKPLGINKYRWEYTPQNIPNTAGGLRLSSLDLAKFGQLYKNKGEWNGKQIIPENWVNESLKKHYALPFDNMSYGYLFWNKNYNYGSAQYEVYACSGNGGNKIFIFSELDLVVVITSTAYNKPYAHKQADRIIEEFILPSVIY